MKITVEYINDNNGKPKAIQLPLTQWNKIEARLKKYEQALKIKADLEEAFTKVKAMRELKGAKQILSFFINEL